jgi:hypothetical protein
MVMTAVIAVVIIVVMAVVRAAVASVPVPMIPRVVTGTKIDDGAIITVVRRGIIGTITRSVIAGAIISRPVVTRADADADVNSGISLSGESRHRK